MQPKKILLTGGAGFIGSHLAESLLKAGYIVYCIDNLDPFYSEEVKMRNLTFSLGNSRFHFIQEDFSNMHGSDWAKSLSSNRFDAIIHLGGKAGVRPSIAEAAAYYRANLTGTQQLLDFARDTGIPKFIFASSSSVYGDNQNLPWIESDRSGNPISPYAASKLAAEEIGLVYRHLYGIQFIALRLFTVYGPRQRPDLAIHKFYDRIEEGKSVMIYGNGESSRDYTYVFDIVRGIMAALQYTGTESLFNLGGTDPVKIIDLVRMIENAMGKQAHINMGPDQEGDVHRTFANIEKAAALLHYRPETSIEKGIEAFVQWKKQLIDLPVFQE